MAEPESLSQVAAACLQEIELGPCADTLGDDPQAQPMGKTDDGLGDRSVALVVLQVGNE